MSCWSRKRKRDDDDQAGAARKRLRTECLNALRQLSERERIEVTHETLGNDSQFAALMEILRQNHGRKDRQFLMFGEHISQTTVFYRFLEVLDAVARTAIVHALTVVTSFATAPRPNGASWDGLVLSRLRTVWTCNKHIARVTVHVADNILPADWARLFCTKSCEAMPRTLLDLTVIARPEMPADVVRRIKAVTKTNKIRKMVGSHLQGVNVLVDLVVACL